MRDPICSFGVGVWGGTEAVEGCASNEAEVVSGVAGTDAASVFVKGHVQRPVEAVLDGPMGPNEDAPSVSRSSRAVPQRTLSPSWCSAAEKNPRASNAIITRANRRSTGPSPSSRWRRPSGLARNFKEIPADQQYKLLRSVIDSLHVDQDSDAWIFLLEKAEAWQKAMETHLIKERADLNNGAYQQTIGGYMNRPPMTPGKVEVVAGTLKAAGIFSTSAYPAAWVGGVIRNPDVYADDPVVRAVAQVRDALGRPYASRSTALKAAPAA